MLIFDTETSGLCPINNQICQLSYIILDENYDVKTTKNFYFAVDFVEMKASNTNGLDKELLDELSNRKTFKDYAEEIYQDFLNSDILVSHNLNFDFDFLKEEFARIDYDVNKIELNNQCFCTMNYYTYVLQIEHDYYMFKYPRLNEVVSYLDINFKYIKEKTKELFNIDNIEDVEYHDARVDVVATMLIYKEVDNNYI